MTLTEKAKEDFEKWYMKTILGYLDPRHIAVQKDKELELFYGYPTSMKWGVYVDFFDSKGVKVNDGAFVDEDYFACVISYEEGQIDVGEYSTRPEARTAALEKANEVYNQTN